MSKSQGEFHSPKKLCRALHSAAAARCGTCRRAEEGSIGENVAVEEDRDIDIKSPERTNRFKSKGMKGKGRLWKKKNGMKYENKNVMKFINT